MFAIKFLIAVVILVCYSLLARSCLKLMGIAATVRSVGLFITSGVLAGAASLIVYGSMLSEEQGHLGDEPQLFTMFSVSVLIAITVSVVVAKLFSVRQQS